MPMTSQHCLVGATCLEGVHYSTRLHDNLHLFYEYSGLGGALCSEISSFEEDKFEGQYENIRVGRVRGPYPAGFYFRDYFLICLANPASHLLHCLC